MISLRQGTHVSEVQDQVPRDEVGVRMAAKCLKAQSVLKAQQSVLKAPLAVLMFSWCDA